MNYIMKIILLIVAFVASINNSNAHFLKLYDEIHFYELKIGPFIYIQPYGTVVRGERNCALEVPENHVSLHSSSIERDEKYYTFKVEPLIYSNYEKTLSFLLKIEFKELKPSSN